MIDNERLDRLLLTLLSGDLSPAEQQELDRALDERPALRGEVERLQIVWRELGASRASERTERAWARLQRRARGEAAARPVLLPETRRTRSGWMMPFAAGLLAAGIVWMIWLPTRPAPITYATAAGEHASIDLGDGSHIVLGPNSHLRSLVGARTVDLDGEASFDVTHDPHRPFAVRAGSVLVRDVGTRFVVQAYRADTTVRVAVAAGRVAVSSPSSGAAEYALGPGDAAAVQPDGLASIAHGMQTAGGAPWEGRLRFDDTPLSDVARGLSWWFGITVVVGDPKLQDRAITGTVALEERPEEALASIALVARVRIIRRDRQFVFMPNP